MPLDWNITECRNLKRPQSDDDQAVTDALIFQTMAVGIAHIKDEATATEFFRRVTVGEKLRGVLLSRWIVEPNKPMTAESCKPRPISLEDCKKRIGLYTNASSYTAAKFWKQIVPKWAQEYAQKKTEAEEAIEGQGTDATDDTNADHHPGMNLQPI